MVDYYYGETEEEAIAKGVAANGGQFVGDENCNDYDGDCDWDGVSRRCECGNRRVYWTTDYIQGRWQAYGEAW
jgi:hypothetical protein